MEPLTCKDCGQPIAFRYTKPTLRTLTHIDWPAVYVPTAAHEPRLDGRDGDYSYQPRKGDVLSTGRYGYVTVVNVHENGVKLDVHTRVHGRQTITRADAGVWWRVAKAGSS